MKITWLGHASFRIETGGQVLLLDPWLEGNPKFDAGRRAGALAGATAILVTHGHGDHAGDAPALAKELGIPVAGIYDWVSHVSGRDGIQGIGFNKGGTIRLGEVAVTMVNAAHSSSMAGPDGPVYAGAEAGYMIRAEGRCLYVMGDTDVMADMGVYGELDRPDFAIVPIGGHFTMDAARAVWACRRFFDFKAVIPSHYLTFPLLAPSAEEFARLMAPVPVHAPAPMESVTL